MSRLGRIYRTSIGAKSVMALTGLALFLFLIGHLSGNLLVFGGQDAMNTYAHWLHDHAKLLWTARIGLLVLFVLHVYTGWVLWLENRAARPERYAKEATVQATISSRTMIWTGLVVLAFVVYHLLHFTLKVVDSGAMHAVDPQGRADVYTMVVTGFAVPVVSISYVVAQLLLGVHLWHAMSSALQTLGWRHPTLDPVLRRGLPLFAMLIVAGNCLIPLAILSGAIGVPS